MLRQKYFIKFLLLTWLFSLIGPLKLSTTATEETAITKSSRRPPPQPSNGPGSSQYLHASVRKVGRCGQGASAYYLYEPDEPAPATAPVVVFMHGYCGVKPAVYGNWIEHLVRRGNIVLFPVYQADLLGLFEFTHNALTAVKDAFHRLAQEPGHVRPDPAGRWALVSHSLGGPISANLAVLAEKSGLPKPLALMMTTPGEANSGPQSLIPSILPPLGEIPDLLLLVVVADSDTVVGEACGTRIFKETTGVAAAHKNLIRLHSDRTGQPPLLADHFSPLAWNDRYEAIHPGDPGIRLIEQKISKALMQTDALDYFGYWKWCDGLLDAAFYGNHREFALGNTPQQRFMGTWSDGAPVREPDVEIGK